MTDLNNRATGLWNQIFQWWHGDGRFSGGESQKITSLTCTPFGKTADTMNQYLKGKAGSSPVS